MTQRLCYKYILRTVFYILKGRNSPTDQNMMYRYLKIRLLWIAIPGGILKRPFGRYISNVESVVRLKERKIIFKVSRDSFSHIFELF